MSATGSRGSTATRRDPIHLSGGKIRNRGPRAKRDTVTITFFVTRPGPVRFRVTRIAPDCEVVGSFTVRARPGVNAVAFAGRLRGVALPPGTYTLAAFARRGERLRPLGRERFVILAPGQARDDARAGRSVCRRGGSESGGGASAATLAATSGSVPGADAALGDEAVASGEETEVAAAGASGEDEGNGQGDAEAATPFRSGEDDEGGAGNLLGPVSNPVSDLPGWLQPFLLGALAAAILCLLAAALPATAVRPAGAAPVVARRRSELALVGALVLGAVALTALLV